MSFVNEYLSIRPATAECILRHNRDKVELIAKDDKLNSPIIRYRWIELKKDTRIDLDKLF